MNQNNSGPVSPMMLYKQYRFANLRCRLYTNACLLIPRKHCALCLCRHSLCLRQLSLSLVRPTQLTRSFRRNRNSRSTHWQHENLVISRLSKTIVIMFRCLRHRLIYNKKGFTLIPTHRVNAPSSLETLLLLVSTFDSTDPCTAWQIMGNPSARTAVETVRKEGNHRLPARLCGVVSVGRFCLCLSVFGAPGERGVKDNLGIVQIFDRFSGVDLRYSPSR